MQKMEVCSKPIVLTITSTAGSLPHVHMPGFHLGFFVWGGGGGEDCVQRSIVCEACKVFEPIFEYQSPMHEKT